MKTKFKFILSILLIAIFFSTSFVFAENSLDVTPISVEAENENSTNITSNEESNLPDEENTENLTSDDSYVDHDIYLTGNNISIDYFVDGNAYIFANDVTISSQISGDVFVFAKNLTVEETSSIAGNVFSVTDSLVLKGLAYDLYSVSNDITFDNGYVYRDIRIISDDFNFYGTIGRNAFVNSSSISFSSDNNEQTGLIYGDFNYSSTKELQIPEGVVNGSVNYNPIEISDSVDISSYFISLGSFIVLSIVVWLLSLWLKPKFINGNTSTKNNALWIVVCGILGVILIPLISILLLFIPMVSRISLLVLSLFFIALAIGQYVFTVSINNFICKKLKISNNVGKLGVLIITSVVLWLLFLIPYNVGFTLSMITMVLGFGILINCVIPKKHRKIDDNIEKNSVDTSEKISKKEEIDKMIAKFDELNTLGIKLVNYNLFLNCTWKILVFCIICIFS